VSGGCAFRWGLLGGLDLQALMANVQAQPPIQTHVQIGEAHQSEPCQEKAAPSGEQQTKTGERQKKCRDVMAEAEFAGEEVEELPLVHAAAVPAFFFAPLAGVTGDFLMRDRPGDGGDGNRQDGQLNELFAAVVHAGYSGGFKTPCGSEYPSRIRHFHRGGQTRSHCG
jgi:hypothetical protein